MAERINLAQFDIDTRLLEDKIAQNQTKIDLLRGEINETKKSIKEYQDQAKLLAGVVTTNNAIQEKANQELQQGIITQDQYNSIIEETSRVIRQSENELSSLLDAEREQQQELVRYQRDLRAVNEENRELNNLLRAGRTEVSGSEGAYRELSNELSAARQEANNLGAQLRQLEQNGQRNTQEYIRLNREWQASATRARELHEELLELDRATGDNRRNVGNYADSIREAFGGIGIGFAQLMSGNIPAGLASIKQGFKDVAGAAKDLWTAILTNPMAALALAVAAVAVGLYQGVKAVFEYNQEISKLNSEISSLTNLTGSVVDRIREYATAIEDVFGRDFQESVKEINSLMKDFGLTSKEAFDLYSEGLAKGGATNSEFGDSIREYGVLFAQNGYSAQEFLNLLNAGIDLDIYTDKLPDAIKEAGLSLNEQTKATRDALINAFGESFSDDLLKRIRNGSATIKQAVDEISAQAQKVGLNTQQIAQLNADVFKGAGEDAGGLIKIIDAVNLANNKNAQSLNNSQEATIKLTEANVDLQKAKTDALKSDSLQSFTKNIELLWVKTETAFYDLIAVFRESTEWLDKITGTSDILGQAWGSLMKYGKEIYNIFKSFEGVLLDLFAALGLNDEESNKWLKTLGSMLNPLNLVKGAINLAIATLKTFSNIIEGSRLLITTFVLTTKSLFAQIIDIGQSVARLDFSGALEKIKNISIADEVKKARIEAEKIISLNRQARQQENEDAQKSSSNVKGNDKTTGATADAEAKAAKERQKLLEKQQREADAARKKAEREAEQAAKQDLANAKERANIAIQATQAELAQYIAMNAEKLKSDKRLTQERVNEITKYLDEVKRQTLDANEQEREQKLKSLDEQLTAIKGFSQQELDQKRNLEAQKEVVRKEYDTKEIQIVNESYEKQKELDKTFIDQKREMQDLARALEYEQRITDLEAQHASEFEIQKVQLQKETEERLAAFLQENDLKRQLGQENYDTNAEIEAQRRELENQIALEQDEIKKQNLSNLLDALNNIQATFANKEVEIARNKELAKYALAAGIAANMAQIAGEQTALGKALAIAETTITTYASAVKAYSSLSGIPIVGPALGAVAAGLAVASGLANVAKIAGVNIPSGVGAGLKGLSDGVVTIGQMSAKPKAADGMLIGPSHENGGINISTPNGAIEAEGGEIIINKRSSAMYRDLLSEINQLGGGVKFASGGIVGNISNLPTVQNNFKSVIDMDLMREIIGDAVLEGSMLGTQAGSQQGIIGLSENREIQMGANF